MKDGELALAVRERVRPPSMTRVDSLLQAAELTTVLADEDA